MVVSISGITGLLTVVSSLLITVTGVTSIATEGLSTTVLPVSCVDVTAGVAISDGTGCVRIITCLALPLKKGNLHFVKRKNVEITDKVTTVGVEAISMLQGSRNTYSGE